MWPKHLDISNEACAGILRRLELEAYSSVVTALRAQGDLTKERRKVLQDLSNVLNVPVERHKAEIRRAVNDELLSTIATTMSGSNSEHEWAREGRRIIPLLRRATPINAFSPLANKTKSDVENYNRMLKSPLETRTPKRAKLRTSLTGEQHSTDLGDLVYTTENGDVRVKPPQISISPLPQKFKALQEFFGGDCEVVILPSGGAVRIKNTPIVNVVEKDADKKLGGRRKRKQSEVGSTTDQVASTPVKTTPAPSYEVFPPGWQLKSPSRPPPPPQPATPAHSGTPFYGMPPPSGGPVGRKETPRGGGRGGRRGQGTTPRSRKPRSSNKLKTAFPIATTEAAFQQQQLIIQQHQQQQQQQQHGYAKPISIPGMLNNSSPGSTQYEALNLVTSMSNNSSIPQSPTSSNSLNSASTITAPKVVVVSSSPSPMTSGTIVSTVNTKPTTTPVSSGQATQILRQNLMSVSVPSSIGMSPYGGPLRMPNIPQMISAAFANGATASNSNNVPPKASQVNNTIPTSTAVTSQQAVSGGNTPSRQAANTQQANAVKLKPEEGQLQQQQQHQLQQNQQQHPGTLKVIPPGTRILPKPGTPMSGMPPVYMVAAGQNVMRIARPVMDDMTGTVSSSAVKLVSAARMITTSGSGVAGATIGFGPQRVVTVNTAALRPTLSAVRPVAVSMANSPGLTRMVQPRVLPTAGGIPRPGAPDKPSVIVVQKGPGGKAVYTKDGPLGQRIMQQQQQQQQQQQAKGGISKPIVIMSKPSSAMSSAASVSSDAYSSGGSTQQGNVIVLDLSQEHQMASNNTSTTLSDLLQASGIMTSDNEGNSDSGSGTSSVGSAACRVGGGQHDNLMEGLNHRQPQQVLLQQRIPAEKLTHTHDAPMPTWSHTNSVMTHRESQHHSAATEVNKFQEQERNLKKQDIFSQAVASAEIEEFATDTVEIVATTSSTTTTTSVGDQDGSALFATSGKPFEEALLSSSPPHSTASATMLNQEGEFDENLKHDNVIQTTSYQ